jgi:hypothetical protein
MTLPRRSADVVEAPLGDCLVLHDAVQSLVHVLNPSARVVWEACDGRTTREDLVSALVDVTGTPRQILSDDIDGYVTDLRSKGLVARDARALPATKPTPAPPAEAKWRSGSFAVLDDAVALTSDDRELVTLVDGMLGTLATEHPPSVLFHASRDGTGLVRLVGRGHDELCCSEDDLLRALTSQLNRVAAGSTTCLALHAGAVRDASGRIVVLPGASGTGKSTLTAALVRAGWDYVTDEAVGAGVASGDIVAYPKPLSLDRTSRIVLGLSVDADLVRPDDIRPGCAVGVGVTGSMGTVGAVALARREPGPPSRRDVPPDEAVTALAGNCFNLTSVGRPGLRLLSRLATDVPCLAVTYPDLDAAVSLLAQD